MEKPVVIMAIAVEKFERGVKAPDAGKILFVDDSGPVDHSLQTMAAAGLLNLIWMIDFAEPLQGRLHHGDPGVRLLTADEVPSVVAGVVGGATVLEIMIVIGNQMAVCPGGPEAFGETVVEWL